MILLEVEQEAEGWSQLGALEALAERAARAVAESGVAGSEEMVAACLFTDDAVMQDLNRRLRGHDKPTNVLSFPSPALPGSPRLIGDIALGFETVAREAESEGKSLADHTTHLLVHGLLHLLGQDHEDDASAETMEAIEVRALARLGIADPYGPAA